MVQYWLENNYFHSTPDNRPPYIDCNSATKRDRDSSHGTHVKQYHSRCFGQKSQNARFNALWVPGTDHASIATEAKVVAKLKSEGINKSDITRDEFLVHAWDWTHKYGGTILEQLKN